MKLAGTGFVASQAGSVASANGVLLRELLKLGYRIDFYAKPSFVDPRSVVSDLLQADHLKLVDCTNQFGDHFRRKYGKGDLGLWNQFCGFVDSWTYHRGLVRSMRRCNGADVDLWLGDWARGRTQRPTVSFVQGPPGTDARSIERHRDEIISLAGVATYRKLAAFARWRLSFALPKFSNSNLIIVGSEWSRNHLIDEHGIDSARVYVLPYPIDLEMFRPIGESRNPAEKLRLLWLGRFVPRKRLRLFLDALAIAIRLGCDVEAWVVGQSGFVPNYESLILGFDFPGRIKHRLTVPRTDIPSLFANVDVLVQPSDDENFGSSVAEALACGVPAVVGATNGTGDYLCDRSARLTDDNPETLAKVIAHYANLKRLGALADRSRSRTVAEHHFEPRQLAQRLDTILNLALTLR